MSEPVWFSLFFGAILLFIVIDLLVVHKRAHHITLREALFWTGFWIAVSLCFNVLIYFTRGSEASLQFFTGYLLEKMLSIDNVFIFTLVFSFFQIAKKYHHRILFLGMLGTIVMRMLFIFGGVALFSALHWTLYIFGVFLIFMAIYLLAQETTLNNFKKNPVLTWVKKHVPVSEEIESGRFFIKKRGQWMMTTLFLSLIIIEFVDLFYAIESIPVIFAITGSPFIIYTSNIFALLGLKSLYFVMAHYLYRFHFMRYGLAVTLGFVGLKILLEPLYSISEWIVILVIFLSFTTCTLLSNKK